MSRLLLGLFSLFAVTAFAAGAPPAPAFVAPAALDWSKAIVTNGVKRIPLAGDRARAAFFSDRLIFPAGFTGLPHTHPVDIHVLVVRGSANIGIGGSFDKTAGNAMGPGSYSFIPANAPHYEWYAEDTEVQMFGIGPMATVPLPAAAP